VCVEYTIEIIIMIKILYAQDDKNIERDKNKRGKDSFPSRVYVLLGFHSVIQEI